MSRLKPGQQNTFVDVGGAFIGFSGAPRPGRNASASGRGNPAPFTRGDRRLGISPARRPAVDAVHAVSIGIVGWHLSFHLGDCAPIYSCTDHCEIVVGAVPGLSASARIYTRDVTGPTATRRRQRMRSLERLKERQQIFPAGEL
jgi:hypothetical protein